MTGFTRLPGLDRQVLADLRGLLAGQEGGLEEIVGVFGSPMSKV